MANNTWLHVVIKLTDKPDTFIAKKLIELSPGVAALQTYGMVQGGRLSLRRVGKKIADIIMAVAGGTYHGNVWATVTTDSGAKPTGVVACTQANASGDTVIFTYGTAAITLTEAGTGVEGFLRGASNTTCAANLAACINAHPVLGGLMTAVGSVGNCNLTFKLPNQGIAGAVIMSTSDGTAFALTQFTGGTVGVSKMWPQALLANKTPV